MIIGLSGYARSGKDTVADILVKEAGFTRVAFADKLREAVYALNPIVSIGVYEDYHWNMEKNLYLQDVIDEYGWDGVKSTPFGPEVRRLLQRMGTEVGRELLGQNIWVDSTFSFMDVTKDYVITDCRFSNEAKRVTQEGGFVWRVNRPGIGPANEHISEIGLDKWHFDGWIENGSTIDELKKGVLRSLDAFRRIYQ